MLVFSCFNIICGIGGRNLNSVALTYAQMISAFTISLAHARMLFILPTHYIAYYALNCSVIPWPASSAPPGLPFAPGPAGQFRQDNCSACRWSVVVCRRSSSAPASSSCAAAPKAQSACFHSPAGSGRGINSLSSARTTGCCSRRTCTCPF